MQAALRAQMPFNGSELPGRERVKRIRSEEEVKKTKRPLYYLWGQKH